MSDLFGEDASAVYDLVYGEAKYDSECATLFETFRKYAEGPVRRVLDVGCGTGAHATRLARHGFHVVAIDQSPSMLDCARRKASDNSFLGSLQLIEGNILSTSSTDVFDAAIMMFNVVGYFSGRDEVREVLRNIRLRLRVGGILVFDFWDAAAVRSTPPTDTLRRYQGDGVLIERESTGQLITNQQACQVVITTKTFQDKVLVREFVEQHLIMFYSLEEIVEICKGCGFVVVNLQSAVCAISSDSRPQWATSLVLRASRTGLES